MATTHPSSPSLRTGNSIWIGVIGNESMCQVSAGLFDGKYKFGTDKDIKILNFITKKVYNPESLRMYCTIKCL